jgi:hypothetical protein
MKVTFIPHKTGTRSGDVYFKVVGGANPALIVLKGTGA